jgi:hypothetical protein
VRYVLVRDGAPPQMRRVLDATPGLTRRSQDDGSALWRVDREVSRISVVSGDKGEAAAGGEAAGAPVAAGPVEAHTTLKPGPAGRVLRVADAADPGWQATLDGRPLDPVTVSGWAQGFELPAEGGRLDLTYTTGTAHTVWLWIQGFLAVVLIVLALPGRRREIDDDLPESATVPAQAVAGEGRRARRLRAAAEAAKGAGGEDLGGFAPRESPSEPAAQTAGVPEQGSYDSDFGSRYGAEYGQSYGEPRYEDQRSYGEKSGESYGRTEDDPYAAQPYDEYAGSADPYGFDPRYGNRSDQQ